MAAAGIAVTAVVAVLTVWQARRDTGGTVAPTVAAEPASLILGVADRRYTDPEGRFAITVPAAWAVRPSDHRRPGDLAFTTFRGPAGLEVWVRLTDVGYDRIDKLFEEVSRQGEQLNISMAPALVQHAGRPTVRRSVRFFDKEALLMDMLAGTTNHHVQLLAPADTFDRHRNLLEQILDSYTPAPDGP